jgi:hypothetical protein
MDKRVIYKNGRGPDTKQGEEALESNTPLVLQTTAHANSLPDKRCISSVMLVLVCNAFNPERVAVEPWLKKQNAKQNKTR